MSGDTRLIIATAVIVGGLVAAFLIPPGMCSHGELARNPGDPSTFSCRILYDVFTAARSLLLLKYAVAIASVVAAAVLAVPVLVRRARSMNGVR
jgi:hypothetical protein